MTVIGLKHSLCKVVTEFGYGGKQACTNCVRKRSWRRRNTTITCYLLEDYHTKGCLFLD